MYSWQTYSLDLVMTQSWEDHRLRSPNVTCDAIFLDTEWLNEIWRPDTYFRNAKSSKFQTIPVPNHYLLLNRDGSLEYVMKITLELSCVMNFVTYPHDTQKCKIQIESCEYEVGTWQRFYLCGSSILF